MPGDILDNRGRGSAGWSWPSIHPEGRKFGAIAAIAAAVVFIFGWSYIAWPLVALTFGILAFFRDPERVTPRDDAFIVAPADGLITLIQKVPPPRELSANDGTGVTGMGTEPVTRVSIFMSVFDVHINRAPIGGTVRRVVYIPGKFLNADLDKASEENERQHFLIERGDGLRIGFTQIAGLIARRIVFTKKIGDRVAAGERVGLIKFGSRTDVLFGPEWEIVVRPGMRVAGGSSVIARRVEREAPDGA